MNPLQAMQMLKSCGNPRQFIQQMMNNSQVANNPIAMNAVEMFQKGDMGGLQAMAENLCREKGTTAEEVRDSVMRQFGLKRY